MIGFLLWFPRMTIERLFRPLERAFDAIEQDVHFLVRTWEDAQK